MRSVNLIPEASFTVTYGNKEISPVSDAIQIEQISANFLRPAESKTYLFQLETKDKSDIVSQVRF
jgi:hypothetical protein